MNRWTLLALMLGIAAIGCRRSSSEPVTKPDLGVVSTGSASADASSSKSVAPPTPVVSLWQTPTPIPAGSSAADLEPFSWQPLYAAAGGPRKVWNIDVAGITKDIRARHAKDQATTQCNWTLLEWFDGPLTRAGANELALLVEPQCDGAPAPAQRRIIIAKSHLRSVATGELFVADRILLDIDLPHGVLAGVGADTDGDGRLEFVVDTSAAPTGSMRLVRASTSAIEVLHDFGALAPDNLTKRDGRVLLWFRRTNPGVELRDDSRLDR